MVKFEVGQKVLCIEDEYVPEFVGTIWVVQEFDFYKRLYMCINWKLSKEAYPFREHEIAEPSSLLKELL